MKILHIRFQNLNSLSGTWDIDFTAPSYAESSLFAITGPTGAGKSTLLDALCLALYGTTPRLGKITRKSNQIMSRHTGICFAEVEFQTVRGHFRCHWSQHRSRQKPGNALQQPKHEITDASSDSILESRIKKVASKVEKVTGMDFERFTRSTLLAQGGFAAFLEASADKRSPILEQITGTEIYSQLSIKVHELRLIEQKKLAELEQKSSLIELLSSEEEEELGRVVAEREKEALSIRVLIARHRENITWLEGIAQLKKEQDSYQTQLSQLQEEKKRHARELSRLQPGLAAKELEPLYLAQQTLLAQQTESLKEQKALSRQRKQAEEEQTILKSAIEKTGKALQQAEQEQTEGLSLVKQVRNLDHILKSTREQLGKETALLQTEEGLKKDEDGTHAKLRKKLTSIQDELNKLDLFFNSHQAVEQLVEDFNAIEILFTALISLNEQQDTIQKQLRLTEREEQSRSEVVEKRSAGLIGLQKQLETATAQQENLQHALDRLMQGAESSELQHNIFTTQNSLQRIRELLVLFHKKTDLTGKIRTLAACRKDTQKQRETAEAKLTVCSKELAAKEKEVELLEKNLFLRTRIQSMEEDRRQLADNVPCPLCGATEHPYRHGEIPDIPEGERELDAAKTELKKIETTLQSLRHQEIADREKMASLARQSEEAAAELTRIEAEMKKLLPPLSLPALTDTSLNLLEATETDLLKELEDRKKLWKQQQELLEDLKKISRHQEELTTSFLQLEKDLLEARHALVTSSLDRKRSTEQAEELDRQISEKRKALATKLRPYESADPEPNKLPVILNDLRQRIAVWKTHKEREKSLVPELASLSSALSHQKTLCEKLRDAIIARNTSITVLHKQLEELQQQRHVLFGDKDPEKEETRLAEMVTALRTTETEQLQSLGKTEQKISGLATLQKRIQQDIKDQETELAKQRELFSDALSRSPFSDTSRFLDSLLPPDTQTALQELQKRFADRERELTALLEEKKEKLQREKDRQLCPEDTTTLSRELTKEEACLESIQEVIIKAKEQLKRNSLDREKSKTQFLEIADQKAVVSNWNRLHGLIGSADGRTFRNFAQGLTFEMMIHHANRHLREMSDRYILVRDKNMPLDLSVIDTYQADEVRSTRNLSGGESFLVSLALALGLSRMASNNVRVDSLFLDEGFGTLDEDALESALDTLARLHGENKLIGIISHVSALKDRVPVQIEITPGSGGNSSISGPGVSRISP